MFQEQHGCRAAGASGGDRGAVRNHAGSDLEAIKRTRAFEWSGSHQGGILNGRGAAGRRASQSGRTPRLGEGRRPGRAVSEDQAPGSPGKRAAERQQPEEQSRPPRGPGRESKGGAPSRREAGPAGRAGRRRGLGAARQTLRGRGARRQRAGAAPEAGTTTTTVLSAGSSGGAEPARGHVVPARHVGESGDLRAGGPTAGRTVDAGTRL